MESKSYIFLRNPTRRPAILSSSGVGNVLPVVISQWWGTECVIQHALQMPVIMMMVIALLMSMFTYTLITTTMKPAGTYAKPEVTTGAARAICIALGRRFTTAIILIRPPFRFLLVNTRLF
eukprot:Rmarinus@m.29418